jgi:hypothetical protein
MNGEMPATFAYSIMSLVEASVGPGGGVVLPLLLLLLLALLPLLLLPLLPLLLLLLLPLPLLLPLLLPALLLAATLLAVLPLPPPHDARVKPVIATTRRK